MATAYESAPRPVLRWHTCSFREFFERSPPPCGITGPACARHCCALFAAGEVCAYAESAPCVRFFIRARDTHALTADCTRCSADRCRHQRKEMRPTAQMPAHIGDLGNNIAPPSRHVAPDSRLSFQDKQRDSPIHGDSRLNSLLPNNITTNINVSYSIKTSCQFCVGKESSSLSRLPGGAA